MQSPRPYLDESIAKPRFDYGALLYLPILALALYLVGAQWVQLANPGYKQHIAATATASASGSVAVSAPRSVSVSPTPSPAPTLRPSVSLSPTPLFVCRDESMCVPWRVSDDVYTEVCGVPVRVCD